MLFQSHPRSDNIPSAHLRVMLPTTNIDHGMPPPFIDISKLYSIFLLVTLDLHIAVR